MTDATKPDSVKTDGAAAAGADAAVPVTTEAAVASAAPAVKAVAPVVPTVAAVATVVAPANRPAFLDSMRDAYRNRGKGVVVLTGATHDLFYGEKGKRFVELEQLIYQAYSDNFTVLRLDIATGIAPYVDSDLKGLADVVAGVDKSRVDAFYKVGNLREQMKLTRHEPLPALVLLRSVLEAVKDASEVEGTGDKVKPVCVVVKFTGSLFPAGDFDKLNELDRQRLVQFLSMIEAPWFKNSSHRIVLVADTRAEVNQRIIALPSVECIEIDLPGASDRRKFVDSYLSENGSDAVKFEKGIDGFVGDTAGLKLTTLRDLLSSAALTKTTLTRKDVLEELNIVLKAELGDIISISKPEHGRKDIIKYEQTTAAFLEIFEACENPQTATAAVLVSGPNGGGKTYQLEAHAADSGRVVIELKGLRGMFFGQTDAFFEKLRLVLKTFGKILILVDEAHTAFGSVHKSDTHETEKRLAGNVIKLMSDESMFGKVLWALATSRPDELDPDVKSRAPDQIPIFDLEGDERKDFVRQMMSRKGLTVGDEELTEVMKLTDNYSNRDYGNLVKKTLRGKTRSPRDTLRRWQASRSILKQRRLQTLIAANHCSYPELVPDKLKPVVGTDVYEAEVQALKLALGYMH